MGFLHTDNADLMDFHILNNQQESIEKQSITRMSQLYNFSAKSRRTFVPKFNLKNK
jgi:hypothetical protein